MTITEPTTAPEDTDTEMTAAPEVRDTLDKLARIAPAYRRIVGGAALTAARAEALRRRHAEAVEWSRNAVAEALSASSYDRAEIEATALVARERLAEWLPATEIDPSAVELGEPYDALADGFRRRHVGAEQL